MPPLLLVGTPAPALIGADHFSYSFVFRFLCCKLRRSLLRISPVVKYSNLMNALESARRRAPLLRFVLSIEIFHRVLLKRNSWISTLLRAPVDQTLFTDVEITSAGTTPPVVRLAFS